jgi:hypothetical protein
MENNYHSGGSTLFLVYQIIMLPVAWNKCSHWEKWLISFLSNCFVSVKHINKTNILSELGCINNKKKMLVHFYPAQLIVEMK